jgi:hypothetical protein
MSYRLDGVTSHSPRSSHLEVNDSRTKYAANYSNGVGGGRWQSSVVAHPGS